MGRCENHIQISVGKRQPKTIFFNAHDNQIGTSCQVGGEGRHTVPLCTTKRRTTTNLKQKITRTARKSKLYGSLTNKEIKKHPPQLIGGVEMGSQGRDDLWQGGGWRTGQSYIHTWMNQEEQLGSETDPQPTVPAWGNKAS